MPQSCNSPASASRSSGITGVSRHVCCVQTTSNIIYCDLIFKFETGSCYIHPWVVELTMWLRLASKPHPSPSCFGLPGHETGTGPTDYRHVSLFYKFTFFCSWFLARDPVPQGRQNKQTETNLEALFPKKGHRSGHLPHFRGHRDQL